MRARCALVLSPGRLLSGCKLYNHCSCRVVMNSSLYIRQSPLSLGDVCEGSRHTAFQAVDSPCGAVPFCGARGASGSVQLLTELRSAVRTCSGELVASPHVAGVASLPFACLP